LELPKDQRQVRAEPGQVQLADKGIPAAIETGIEGTVVGGEVAGSSAGTCGDVAASGLSLADTPKASTDPLGCTSSTW
jgi:hypothetical protein